MGRRRNNSFRGTAVYIENQFRKQTGLDEIPFDVDLEGEPVYNDNIFDHMIFEVEVAKKSFQKFLKMVPTSYPKATAFKVYPLKSGRMYCVGYDTEANLLLYEARYTPPKDSLEVENH